MLRLNNFYVQRMPNIPPLDEIQVLRINTIMMWNDEVGDSHLNDEDMAVEIYRV